MRHTWIVTYRKDHDYLKVIKKYIRFKDNINSVLRVIRTGSENNTKAIDKQ